MKNRPPRGPFSLSMALLWLAGAVVVGPFSWITAPASATANYGLSVTGWFAGFAVAYFILERVRLGFSRVGAWFHLGLMTLGTMLITVPYFFLNTIQIPTSGPAMIAVYRTLSAVTTVGYGFNLLGLAAFIGVLIHTAWIALRTRV